MIKSIQISDFATANAVLRDPAFAAFDVAGHLRRVNEQAPKDLGVLVHTAENNPFFLEGPRLRTLHLLVARILAPQRIPQWKPVVERAVEDCLDRLPLQEHPDLVRDFIEPVFLAVTGAVLGFDATNGPQFKHWIDDSWDFLEPLLPLRRLSRIKIVLDEINAHLIATAFRPPVEGPASLSYELLQHISDDFTYDDAVKLVTVLMIVGQATPHTLANMILYVLRMPAEARQAVTGEQAPAWFEANLEMVLRLSSSIRAIGRIALRPGTVGAHTFEEGDVLLLDMFPANRDQSVFPMENGCPMSKRSSSADHLVFSSGRHMCPGAPLARLIVGTALPRLFQRYPHTTLADEPQMDQSTFFRTASTLPCKL